MFDFATQALALDCVTLYALGALAVGAILYLASKAT